MQPNVAIQVKIAFFSALKIGFTYFIPTTKTRINTSKIMSLVKDSHGVSFTASPKQPQSVTLLK